jgi:hypothetical protein
MAAPSLRASTLASYESLVHSRVLPALGRFRLGDLRPSDVQDFVNDLAAEGLSVSRIRKCRIVLGLMLDAAVREGIIARNVARGARLPRATRREAAYFEPEIVDAIIADLDEPYALPFGYSVCSGFAMGKRSPSSDGPSTGCVVASWFSGR